MKRFKRKYKVYNKNLYEVIIQEENKKTIIGSDYCKLEKRYTIFVEVYYKGQLVDKHFNVYYKPISKIINELVSIYELTNGSFFYLKNKMEVLAK
jgi:hypothetical protein